MPKKIKYDNKELVEHSDRDLICLHHVLLSYKDWLAEGPTVNKATQCMEHMFNDWREKLRQRGLAIPANNDDLVDLIVSQPDYRNRQQREEEAKNAEGDILYDVIEICKDSNLLARETCPYNKTRTVIFRKESTPTDDCDVH